MEANGKQLPPQRMPEGPGGEGRGTFGSGPQVLSVMIHLSQSWPIFSRSAFTRGTIYEQKVTHQIRSTVKKIGAKLLLFS